MKGDYKDRAYHTALRRKVLYELSAAKEDILNLHPQSELINCQSVGIK